MLGNKYYPALLTVHGCTAVSAGYYIIGLTLCSGGVRVQGEDLPAGPVVAGRLQLQLHL